MILTELRNQKEIALAYVAWGDLLLVSFFIRNNLCSFCCRSCGGFIKDDYLGAGGGFAGEAFHLDAAEGNYAIFGGVNREVAGHKGAGTSQLGAANLANQNFTLADFLTTKALQAQALTGRVVDVFGGAASFNV